MADLSVIILTFNEQRHICRAIESVSPIAREVFVIDSFSTDGTVELAGERGAHILQHHFVNHAKQLQWAIENAPITSKWVMRLDADEIIEADLAQEIEERLAKLGAEVAGVRLKRKHIFLGRWIRHGGRYPLILLRIWRRGCGRVEQRWMDEHIIVDHGRVVTFNGGFADHNLGDLTSFVSKHNKYATLEAVEVLNRKLHVFPIDNEMSSTNNSPENFRKRFIKDNIYNKIPFQVSALSYFLYRWVLRAGFLDGVEGLIYHFLQGFWYRFLVGAKVLEFQRAIASLNDPIRRKTELARLTGLEL